MYEGLNASGAFSLLLKFCNARYAHNAEASNAPLDVQIDSLPEGATWFLGIFF